MAAALRRIAVLLLPSWALVLIAAQACTPDLPQVAVLSVAAVLSSLWLFAGLQRLLEASPSPERTSQAMRVPSLVGWLLLAALLITAFAYLSGPRHDYRGYLRQWDIILAGADPWLNTKNAYGPLHNLWAWIRSIHPLLPKLIFALLLVGTGAVSAFTPLGIRDRTDPAQRIGLLAVLVLSPFCLITVGLYGNNDILPAAAMVIALIGVSAGHHRTARLLSGAILAIGSLVKFYPLIILPALVFRRRRVDMAVLSGFLATFGLGLILSYATWGQSLFLPLVFAGSRESKHLSIFNFTRSILDLNLDRFSAPLMVIAFLLICGFVIFRDVGPLLGSSVVFATTLSVYKVGHQQFFLFFFLVAPYALRTYLSGSNLITPAVSRALFAWLGFLNWYQLQYALTCGLWGGPARPLRHLGALGYLAFSAVMMATLLLRLQDRDLRLPGRLAPDSALPAADLSPLPAAELRPPGPPHL